MTDSAFSKDSRAHCVIVFKSRRRWSEHLEEKLRLKYKVVTIEALPVIIESGYSGLSDKLEEFIKVYGAQCVFFSVDFFYGLDIEFIKSVSSSIPKVLVTLDDISLHEFNSINALACDLVLSADPVSVLKYEEKTICSEYLALESSKRIYRNLGLPKTIDVLFYGNCELPSRKSLINYLRASGIDVSVFGEDSTFLSQSELVRAINQAKIVINFSKTGYLKREPAYRGLSPTLNQLKGRIIEVGLCGTACISEYSPGIGLLFTTKEIITFNTRQDCLDKIKGVLTNDKQRAELASNLFRKCVSQYEDIPLMDRVYERLESIQNSDRGKVGIDDTELKKIPFWYRRLVLRTRVHHLINNKSELWSEIRTLIGSENITLKVKLALTVDLLCWLPYHLLGRLRAAIVIK